jgi:hypothetical protein
MARPKLDHPITRFEVHGWLKHAEEDLFKDGCQPDTATQFSGPDGWHGDTLSALIEELCGFVPFATSDSESVTLDACDEPGRIDICGMETGGGEEPSNYQMDRWKQGQQRLWYVTYTFYVEKVTHETHWLRTLPAVIA